MQIAAFARISGVPPSPTGTPREESNAFRSQRRRAYAALLAAALISAGACGTTKKAPGDPPLSAAPTATPALTPTAAAATPMPVTTPSSSSIYDRTPGVIYEEKGPAPSTPVGATPTHRAPTAEPRLTPTRRPGPAA